MLLLIDTDAFCKLATVGLLEKAVSVLGVDIKACRRLPALLPMLRRGRLHKAYGDECAEALISLAETIPAAPEAPRTWLDRMVSIHDVDPGEAHLLAVAASSDALLLTGDKRALSAIRLLPGFAAALRGKLVLLEIVLLILCDRLGDEAVRAAVGGANVSDVMLQVCFSSANSSPRDGLQSYVSDSRGDLAPLDLWTPAPSPGGPP